MSGQAEQLQQLMAFFQLATGQGAVEMPRADGGRKRGAPAKASPSLRRTGTDGGVDESHFSQF
jgi:hypothetical protein